MGLTETWLTPLHTLEETESELWIKCMSTVSFTFFAIYDLLVVFNSLSSLEWHFQRKKHGHSKHFVKKSESEEEEEEWTMKVILMDKDGFKIAISKTGRFQIGQLWNYGSKWIDLIAVGLGTPTHTGISLGCFHF